mmetsp:Transcript_103695/g.187111  ORF Transcript_103695/g.187111 Transcript_103695/m.187111 type:complete len:83 (-) Transcript_103695:912-1160(-)
MVPSPILNLLGFLCFRLLDWDYVLRKVGNVSCSFAQKAKCGGLTNLPRPPASACKLPPMSLPHGIGSIPMKDQVAFGFHGLL